MKSLQIANKKFALLVQLYVLSETSNCQFTYSIVQKFCKHLSTKFNEIPGFSTNFGPKPNLGDISVDFRGSYCSNSSEISQINSEGMYVSLENVRNFSEKVVRYYSFKHYVCEGKLLHNKTYGLSHYDPVSNQTASIPSPLISSFRSASQMD